MAAPIGLQAGKVLAGRSQGSAHPPIPGQEPHRTRTCKIMEPSSLSYCFLFFIYLNLCFQIQYQAALSVPCRTSSSVLPPPTLKLPPTSFSSPDRLLTSLEPISDATPKTATLDALDDLSTPATGGGATSLGALDALDGLDSLDEFPDMTSSVTVLAADENESKSELDEREKSINELLGELYPDEFNGNIGSVRTVEHLGSLDALDSFPSEKGVVAPLPAVPFGDTGKKPLILKGSFTQN